LIARGLNRGFPQMPESDEANNSAAEHGPEGTRAETEKQGRPPAAPTAPGAEIGGQAGPEPTRYGDWERNGRCTDF
jgi:hypothetical protein